MKPLLRVVSGLALNHTRLGLMGLRRADKLRGGLWELPGGKVEDGEDPKDALAREWREELGVNVTVGPFIASTDLEMEEPFVVDLYSVIIEHPQYPKTLDHQEIRWVDLYEAMQKMPCSPAFYRHWPRIRDVLGVLAH